MYCVSVWLWLLVANLKFDQMDLMQFAGPGISHHMNLSSLAQYCVKSVCCVYPSHVCEFVGVCRQSVFPGMYCSADSCRQQVTSLSEHCTVWHQARLAWENSCCWHRVCLLLTEIMLICVNIYWSWVCSCEHRVY